jgi:hypothetical protein
MAVPKVYIKGSSVLSRREGSRWQGPRTIKLAECAAAAVAFCPVGQSELNPGPALLGIPAATCYPLASITNINTTHSWRFSQPPAFCHILRVGFVFLVTEQEIHHCTYVIK